MARAKSKEEKVHLSVQVQPSVIEMIDDEARRLTEELRIPVNRTVALTRILDEWRQSRGAKA